MEKNTKLQRTFDKFEKSFGKFREIIESLELFSFLNEELIVEVATKRFEYTFESLWKTIKEYLRPQGVECPTPLMAFREAFKAGIIEERFEEIFIEMIDKRNQIVHVYDFDQDKTIYAFLRGPLIMEALKRVYEKLRVRIGEAV